MIPFKPTFAAAIASIALFGSLSAQESDFDLASQRSEIQQVRSVPGRKVDHGGIIINPVPQKMLIDRDQWLDISRGFNPIGSAKTYAVELSFAPLSSKGVRMEIAFGPEVAVKRGLEAVSGAYALSIDGSGISIFGYDDRGAFYGIQTLRQLIESCDAEARLPQTRIEDYPDLPDRGVVEGFYGTPWSHEVRLSLIDFYGKNKMNTYFYGPKDDPYHSCPDWRLPYPEKEAAQIGELIRACRRNRVDFVWAIHPGQDIRWNDEDYRNLVNKLGWMYDLGVRDFAVFFDDISGEGTDPAKQTELLNRLKEDFAREKGDVASLTVCPTDYSRLWANPSPEGSLAIYGRTLDPQIKVFWTGDVVCSDLTPETLAWVNSRIARPALFWWNYPVTDYVRNIVMQGPVYGLDTSLTASEVCGVVSNPMEHGEASKLALYGVSDYAWNIGDYNPIDNWERGLQALVPEACEAYRTFAIHSADTETGYRRDESWETKTFRIADWDDAAAKALYEEFLRIERVPEQMEQGCSNRELLRELRPWLAEFGKLGTRGKRTIELANIYRSGKDDAAFWEGYLQNLMSPEDRKAYEAHKSGTMKLQPFYEYAMDDMAHEFLMKLAGKTPNDYRGIGSFASAATIRTKQMLDRDTSTYYTSGTAQQAGDWIGIDLRTVRDVREVSILQGRNSTDDVDYFDHAIVEYSENGNVWYPLTGELVRKYVIHWQGEPVKARYVRLKRLDSERTNYASVRSFEVNPPRPGQPGFRLEAVDPQQAVDAFDLDPATGYTNQTTLSFEIPSGTKAYTLLLNRLSSPIRFSQLTSDGKLAAQTSIETPFCRIEVAEGASEAVIEGPVQIFEIINEHN